MFCFDEALDVLNRYSSFPETREKQAALLRSRGYRCLRGGGLIVECKDKQVRAVAHRVMEEAERIFFEEVKRERMTEEYYCRLYSTFNIPDSQREDVAPAELEKMLLE